MFVMQQKRDNTFGDTSPTGCAGFPSTIQSYNIPGLIFTKRCQKLVCMWYMHICLCVDTCVACTHVGVVYAYLFVCICVYVYGIFMRVVYVCVVYAHVCVCARAHKSGELKL